MQFYEMLLIKPFLVDLFISMPKILVFPYFFSKFFGIC